MCFFITIAVPAAKAGLVPEVFGRGFHLSSTSNPAVAAALPAGYAAMLVTDGHCSCNLYASPRSATEADPEGHLRKKYAKRGWGEAKIARAVEQAKAGGARKPHARGLRPDVADGLRALCRAAGMVAVVVHWYGGDVEAERLSLKRAEACDCADLPARAREFPEDEVLIALVGLASQP